MKALFQQTVFTLSLASVAACGPELEPAEAPALEAAEQSVVYGTDDRVNVRDHASAALRTAAQSVMVQTIDSRVAINRSTGAVTLTLDGEVDLCAGEAFEAEQAASRWCTVFLVAPDRIMTAGHCLDWNKNNTLDGTDLADFCREARFVADFVREADGPGGQVRTHALDVNDVYRCKEVISAQLTSGQGGLDYAVVQLDRPTGRPGLPLDPNARATLTAGDDLVVIGHPDLLPMKIEDGGQVRDPRRNQNDFIANTDTFGGNSGSPVLDDQGNVIGILVRGETDYLHDAANDCYTVNTVANNAGRGEDIVHIAALGRFADSEEPNDIRDDQKATPLVFRAAPDGGAGNTVLRAGLGEGQGPGFLRIAANDYDYFAIPAVGGDDVEILVTFSDADGDIDIELFDEAGGTLGTSHSVTDDESISISAPGSGLQPMYLRVRGYGGATNDYGLEVVLRPAANFGTCDIDAPCSSSVCNPRPGRIAPLSADEYVDLGRAPGVCEAVFDCTPNYPGGPLDCHVASHVVHLPVESAHPYANSLDATWAIGLPSGFGAVSLLMDSYDIEVGFDALQLTDGTVIDGSAQSAQLADTAATVGVGPVDQPGLKLRLTTDGSVQKFGFKMTGFVW